jgi:hypothetical protein
MPWPIVLIAGFVLPGAGHFLLGERKRGVLIGFAVVLLFVAGLLVGGVRVVELPDFTTRGNLLSQLLAQPAFLGQFFAGPLALMAGYLSKLLAADPTTTAIVSHSRIYDIGMLYTAIAGALNLLAIVDSTSRSAAGTPPRDGTLPRDGSPA